MRGIQVLATAAMLAALAGLASAGEPPLGIEPDPRAVESGLYIRPVAAAKTARLDFAVTEPLGVARKACPVRGGLPFHRGELVDPKAIRLLDGGREIPSRVSRRPSGRRGP